MSFYGVGVGTGHSVVTTRFAYLNTTFWSHRRLFPHIGVCVGTQADYDFITKVRVGTESKLQPHYAADGPPGRLLSFSNSIYSLALLNFPLLSTYPRPTLGPLRLTACSLDPSF